jgi:aryl-alcohol dehydrogenase-like predicted oxidoreductase
MNNQPIETVQLGTTDVRVTPLGVGTWQWGDSMFWGYRRGYAEDEIKTAFDASLAAGINFLDMLGLAGRSASSVR